MKHLLIILLLALCLSGTRLNAHAIDDLTIHVDITRRDTTLTCSVWLSPIARSRLIPDSSAAKAKTFVIEALQISERGRALSPSASSVHFDTPLNSPTIEGPGTDCRVTLVFDLQHACTTLNVDWRDTDTFTLLTRYYAELDDIRRSQYQLPEPAEPHTPEIPMLMMGKGMPTHSNAFSPEAPNHVWVAKPR